MVLTHPILPTLHDAPLPVLLVLFVVYLAPSVVALTTSRQQFHPVLAINLLLGWTVVGWAISLAVALGRTRLGGRKTADLEMSQLFGRGWPAATVRAHSDLPDAAADPSRTRSSARPCAGQAPKPPPELPRDLSDSGDHHGRSA
jgi:hypothetical protein